MKKRILVVDDEARIREVVQYALEREGYEVTLAADGRAALESAEREDFDVVVLDVMLPEVDGLEVCRQLRAGKRPPVLFLSARSEEVDRIVGLEIGGDDYLTKPFSPRELVARVRALLRRIEELTDSSVAASAEAITSERAAVLEHGQLRIDTQRHQVHWAGELVPDLTPTELGVLIALYEEPGVVLSRADLMQRGYDESTVVTERTIDTHVRRIRSKFRRLGADPVSTVHGVGYKAREG